MLGAGRDFIIPSRCVRAARFFTVRYTTNGGAGRASGLNSGRVCKMAPKFNLFKPAVIVAAAASAANYYGGARGRTPAGHSGAAAALAGRGGSGLIAATVWRTSVIDSDVYVLLLLLSRLDLTAPPTSAAR